MKRRSETNSPNKKSRDRYAEIDWDNWVSATSVRNYLLGDPLIDYLAWHSSRLALAKPGYASRVLRAIQHKDLHNFTEFIMAQGKDFETNLMDLLFKKFGPDMIASVGGELNAKSERKVTETLEVMNKGVPFIHSGVLHNFETQTYGIPDLLVRSDWLDQLVALTPLPKEARKLSAPSLTNPFNGAPPKYHYRVVDIKFSTLYLRSDGLHLLNSGSIPAYKGQLYIYNQALGQLQGYLPPVAYVLGRKWKYSTRGSTYQGRACLDRLGLVDFTTVDLEYVEKTQKAIQWIRDVRQHGHTWDLFTTPLPREELYPNMSNSHDYPWHGVKEQLAKDLDEITMLWMCGVKNRKKAHEVGVYRWTDLRCTTETLGVHGEATSKVLTSIIDINQHGRIVKILPAQIQNNDHEWQTTPTLEFYVDFETVNDVLTDFSRLPIVESCSMIFTIGVGYFDTAGDATSPRGRWVFRDFTVDALTLTEEAKICARFSEYIRSECVFYEIDSPLLVHWHSAEPNEWKKAIERHGGARKVLSQGWLLMDGDEGSGDYAPRELRESTTQQSPPRRPLQITPQWFDLLQVFHAEPIVIKGCLGFGLKEISKALYEMGHIETTWDGGSACVDGVGAMLGAYSASKEARRRGTSMKILPAMREIIRYNEVDCKVLGEILRYLRAHHTASEIYLDEVLDLT